MSQAKPKHQTRSRPFTWLSILVKGAIAAVLLFYLWTQTGIDAGLMISALDTLGAVAVSILLIFLMIATNGYRWYRLLRGLGLSVSLVGCQKLNYAATFASVFLPGGTGLDIIRYLGTTGANPETPTRVVAAIVMDRIVGLSALLAVATITASVLALSSPLPAWLLNTVVFPLIILSLIGLVLFTLLWFRGSRGPDQEHHPAAPSPSEKVRATIFLFLQALLSYRRKGPKLLAAFGVGILSVLLLTGAMLFAGRAIQITIPARVAPFTVATSAIINMVPITPGGLGAGEMAFQTLSAEAAGQTAAYATVFLLYRLLFLLSTAPGALLVVNVIQRRQCPSLPKSAQGTNQNQTMP